MYAARKGQVTDDRGVELWELPRSINRPRLINEPVRFTCLIRFNLSGLRVTCDVKRIKYYFSVIMLLNFNVYIDSMETLTCTAVPTTRPAIRFAVSNNTIFAAVLTALSRTARAIPSPRTPVIVTVVPPVIGPLSDIYRNRFIRGLFEMYLWVISDASDGVVHHEGVGLCQDGSGSA